MRVIDPHTKHAARMFLDRVSGLYPIVEARLFGSRARGTHRPDSDVDLAVTLSGAPSDAASIGVEMAGVAFDVMLETGVLVSPLPIWEAEWAEPQNFSNPGLLERIRAEGIRV
jgi:uncharacterized protein